MGSTRGALPLWTGVPQTEEWSVVSAKLWRVFAPPAPALAAAAGTGISRYGGRTGAAAAAGADALASYKRTAVLSPAPAFTHSLSPLPARHASLRTLTVVSNSDALLGTLIGCVDRVETLMHVGAYLHWYERFGVTKDHLRAASESLLNTVDAYITASGASL